MKNLSKDLLAEIARRLNDEFHPEQVWLFGSHARGTAGPDSDIDLLVIVSESDERPARRMQRAQRCLRGIPAPADVFVQTRNEFASHRNIRASFTNRILREGRKVYG